MSEVQENIGLFLKTPSLSQPSEGRIFLQPYHNAFVAEKLISVAQGLVNPRGRGIYATDEAPYAIDAILDSVSDPPTSGLSGEEKTERRRAWRKAAYKAVISEYVSGVILSSDTIADPELVSILTKKGVIPGVRANGELVPFANSPLEYYGEGLDGLLPTLQAAYIAGARFSKWRVPIACNSASLPTQMSLETQAETLATFAAISQQAGLVPIVEPDVEFLADADLARSVEVHQKVIRMIFSRCLDRGVLLEGTLLKPSYPQPGLLNESRKTCMSVDIAMAAASVIANAVPSSVAGVVFLSGGLSTAVAISHLEALNMLVNSASATSPMSRLPPLSFSYGRAIQGDALKYWGKRDYSALSKSIETNTKACSMAVHGE